MVLQKRSPAIGRLGAFDEGTQVEVCPIFVKRFTSIYTVFTTVYFFLHRFTLIYPAPGRLSKLSFRHDHLHGSQAAWAAQWDQFFVAPLQVAIGSWNAQFRCVIVQRLTWMMNDDDIWWSWVVRTMFLYIHVHFKKSPSCIVRRVWSQNRILRVHTPSYRFSQGEIHHLSAVHKSKKSGILLALRRFCIANPTMFFGSLNSASFSSLRCSWFRGCSSIQGIGPSPWEIASNLKRDPFGWFFPCNLAVGSMFHPLNLR